MKYLGPDKPAAEWILLNGGQVKMAGSNRWITSFWDFPHHEYSPSFKLTHINADNTEVTSTGFRYIKNVPYIQAASFSNCKYVDDRALPHLQASADSANLKVLNLSKTSITPEGVSLLADFKSLKFLDISECRKLSPRQSIMTSSAGDPMMTSPELEEIVIHLKSHLPRCSIILKPSRVISENL